MRKMQRLKMFRKLKHYAVTNDGTLTNINIFMEKIQKKRKTEHSTVVLLNAGKSKK